MLKAHLDPDYEAASRKIDFIDKSVSWINEICPSGEMPCLLDIACGPGIYAEKFTQAGYEVTGIDFSKRSIDYANQSTLEKGMNIHYHYQDYLKMNLQKQFDLETLIYCDYGALSTEDRKVIMNKAYQHLKPGGKLLLDVFTLTAFEKKQEFTYWDDCPGNGFWREEKHITLNRCCKYPGNITLDLTAIITEKEVTTYYIWDTAFSKEALIAEAQASGFKLCGIYGDVAGAEYSDESETMAILLQK